jgi:hypothetical protein
MPQDCYQTLAMTTLKPQSYNFWWPEIIKSEYSYKTVMNTHGYSHLETVLCCEAAPRVRRPSKLSAKHSDTSTESFPKFTGCNGTIEIACDILKCYNQLVILNKTLKWLSYQASWYTWTKLYQRGQLTAWNYAVIRNMKSKWQPDSSLRYDRWDKTSCETES